MTTQTTTRPAVTVEQDWNVDRERPWYQATCAEGHLSGWCVSEQQARSFLAAAFCPACREAVR